VQLVFLKLSTGPIKESIELVVPTANNYKSHYCPSPKDQTMPCPSGGVSCSEESICADD